MNGRIRVGLIGLCFVMMYCLCEANPTNAQTWSFPFEARFVTLTAGADETICFIAIDEYEEEIPGFPDYEGTVFALNLDGTQKWTFPLGVVTIDDSVFTTPLIGPDGTIYFGWSWSVYALNPDGTQKWKFSPGGRVFSTPAIGTDGTVYFCVDGSPDYLYAVNPDGTEKWVFHDGYSRISPTIGADGTIYVCSGNELIAVNPEGTQEWALPIEAELEMVYSPTVGPDGTIYFCIAQDQEDSNYDAVSLYAVSSEGTLQWTFFVPNPNGIENYVAKPAVGSDGTIYFNSYDKHLYALNPDGTEKWTHFVDSFPRSPMISSDGTIFLSCESSNFLYALNPDGTRKWTFTPSNSIISDLTDPAIRPDGTVYVASYYWYQAVPPPLADDWRADLYAIPADFAEPVWSVASTVMYESQSRSDALNYLLLLLIPMGAVLLWKVRRKRS